MSETSRKERQKRGEWHLGVALSEWYPHIGYRTDLMSLAANQPALEQKDIVSEFELFFFCSFFVELLSGIHVLIKFIIKK